MTTALQATAYERVFLVGLDAPLSAQSHLHRGSDRQQTSFVDYIANFGQFHTKKLRVLRPKPANCHNTVRSDSIPTQ